MLRRLPVSYLAYVALLMGFVALGLFVYALAAQSHLAVLAGLALVLFFGAALVGFRTGERHIADSAQIERYLSTYRGESSQPRVVSLRTDAAAGMQRAA